MKKPNFLYDTEVELYLVKIYEILIGKKDSYKIYLAINTKSKILNHQNTLICVEFLENTQEFLSFFDKKILIFHGDSPFISENSITQSIFTLNKHFGTINSTISNEKNAKHAKIFFNKHGFISKLVQFKEYQYNGNLKKITDCGGGIFACKKRIFKISFK